MSEKNREKNRDTAIADAVRANVDQLNRVLCRAGDEGLTVEFSVVLVGESIAGSKKYPKIESVVITKDV